MKPGDGKRVLIVDDDELNLKLATILLGDAGFIVETVGSAEEALRFMVEEAPDAVLSDVRMTGMSGYELRQKLLEDDRLARIPVVLVSSASPLDRQPPESIDKTHVRRTSDLREAIDALVAGINATWSA